MGGGEFALTDTGPGACSLPIPALRNYNLTETADARAGQMSQTGTDYDRYSYLLERFNNVSNTGGGNDPGNMNFSPVGQAFVDPDPLPEYYIDANGDVGIRTPSTLIPPNPNAGGGLGVGGFFAALGAGVMNGLHMFNQDITFGLIPYYNRVGNSARAESGSPLQDFASRTARELFSGRLAQGAGTSYCGLQHLRLALRELLQRQERTFGKDFLSSNEASR